MSQVSSFSISKDEILEAIRKIVERAKQIQISFSADGGESKLVVSGEAAIDKIQELVDDARLTRVVICNSSGDEIASFPLVAGVVGAVILPTIVLFLTTVAVLTDCSVTFEAKEKKEEEA